MENKHDITAERQSLKDKLMAIILLETSKPCREMDSDLVTECVDFLMELEGKERLTKSEIEQRVNEIPFKGKVTAIGSYTKKKVRAKRLAVIAAVLAVIIALFGIFAIASGDTFSELFRQMGSSLLDMLDKGNADYNGITIYKPNETKEYSSINELVEEEGIEILYPSWLPENEKIVSVIYFVEGETKTYSLQCDNPAYSISIVLDSELNDNLKSDCTEKEIAGHTVYYDFKDTFYQANFIYNNDTYRIKAYTENDLFKIIENLEEIE